MRPGSRRRARSSSAPSSGRTLATVDADRRVRIVRITGGRRLVHRLAALGVIPGAVVTVRRGRGPAIVSLNGTRLAVGRHAASAIEVEEIDR